MNAQVCSRGHRYEKTLLSPVCPQCWPGYYKKQNDFPKGMSAPSIRALLHAKITSLKALSKYSEKDILAFHGMGPASLPLLRKALKAKKLSFKK